MSPRSRGAMRPRLASTLPSLERRAQGRPGARCTRGLVCKHAQKHAHEHTGSAETLRPSPRNGFTAYSALSPVTGFLATVAPRALPQNLTPASGRQNHTTSPYASASTASHRNVRDDREPPLLSGETRRVKPVICPTTEAEYFCAKDWTTQITLIGIGNFRFSRTAFNRPPAWESAFCNGLKKLVFLEYRAPTRQRLAGARSDVAAPSCPAVQRGINRLYRRAENDLDARHKLKHAIALLASMEAVTSVSEIKPGETSTLHDRPDHKCCLDG